MKFLDANILIYACFVPRSTLTSKEKSLKEKSQAILRRVDEGEPVAISEIYTFDRDFKKFSWIKVVQK